MNSLVMGEDHGKGTSQLFAIAAERQRREELNRKYKDLRHLVPNPTKGTDRASIVHDVIKYIKELLRTVEKLKILVDKKRYVRETIKKLKTEDEAVDVHINEDEVTIKLIQPKKMNCLLSVSKIMDELHLDLLHVSSENIGETYCFLFNTKINEGSSVYAQSIANKLTEALNEDYSTFQEVVETLREISFSFLLLVGSLSVLFSFFLFTVEHNFPVLTFKGDWYICGLCSLKRLHGDYEENLWLPSRLFLV